MANNLHIQFSIGEKVHIKSRNKEGIVDEIKIHIKEDGTESYLYHVRAVDNFASWYPQGDLWFPDMIDKNKYQTEKEIIDLLINSFLAYGGVDKLQTVAELYSQGEELKKMVKEV